MESRKAMSIYADILQMLVAERKVITTKFIIEPT